MENNDFEQLEETKMKKIYSTPKIEVIGDVRDVTAGATGWNEDGATKLGNNPPSQPVGG